MQRPGHPIPQEVGGLLSPALGSMLGENPRRWPPGMEAEGMPQDLALYQAEPTRGGGGDWASCRM
eukprot:4258940-Prorocentrum_lima.AAC.1